MRLFTILVFDQFVRDAITVTSPPEFNEVLGKAHDLVYEVEVEEAGGTSPTIAVVHRMSNSGKGFVAAATILATTTLATGLPLRVLGNQLGPLASQGQIAVTIGGTNTPFARVRVWATGWSA